MYGDGSRVGMVRGGYYDGGVTCKLLQVYIYVTYKLAHVTNIYPLKVDRRSQIHLKFSENKFFVVVLKDL